MEHGVGVEDLEKLVQVANCVNIDVKELIVPGINIKVKIVDSKINIGDHNYFRKELILLKKIKDAILRDFWVVILDIVAVNLSYGLALVMRFYVNFQFRPVAEERYLPAFLDFAPWYTLCCLVIFALFKLYGGLWKYAGINDMNRIILANLCTLAVQLIGSISFFTRMPITYYVIGAMLQLLMVILIRFSYKFITIEREKLASRKIPAINVMVVGLGMIGQQVIKQVKDNPAFHLSCILDSETSMDGKMMDGIPVVGGINQINKALEIYKIQSVFIADQQISSEQRKEIYNQCDKNKAEIQDYTGYLSNADDSAPLSSVLSVIKGPITVLVNGEELDYENNYQALKDLTGRYTIQTISVKDSHIVLNLRSNQQTVFVLSEDKEEAYVGYDAWAQRRRDQK